MSLTSGSLILLNFGHPLTPAQCAQIESITGGTLVRVETVASQFDHDQPFPDQARALIESVGLSADDWQTLPLLVNLPGHSVIAALILAEIHGRRGHFPAVIRMRPVSGVVPGVFEVAEVLNLQNVRESARLRRGT